MQINIEGLDNRELMNRGVHHFRNNISYEVNLINNLVEGLLLVSEAIIESDLISGQPNVADDEHN